MRPESQALLSRPARSGWSLPWIQRLLAPVFSEADVVLNGRRPWDPQVQTARVFRRILARGTLGAGDAYVDGDWECDALDELTTRLVRSEVDYGVVFGLAASSDVLTRVTNRQTVAHARHNATVHYDRGNDLYEAMLGPTMTYSCGYWRAAPSLDAAQDAKHALACRKLHLEPGMRLLDIGCGWGALAKYAAQKHGVEVVGVTLSPAQADYAKAHCRGLPVEIRLCDYRELSGCFDRIVSVGMFEHVGVPNYKRFFEVVRDALAADGLFLLHTIGGSRSVRSIDPWIDAHIFPNAVLPSAKQIAYAAERLFVLEDWHNFGADYDRTLMSWYANFEAAWPSLRARYDERFRRMWRYYLLTCAGTFRARRNQLWQIVFSKRGVRGGYQRVAA